MQRLKFYRVEDSRQWGMYNSVNRPYEVSSEMDEVTGRHPTWREDSQLRYLCEQNNVDPVDVDWRFAFCSLEQLKCWIYRDDWRQTLSECGFVVSTLEAEGFHGDTQGVYLASTRVDIETLSILEV